MASTRDRIIVRAQGGEPVPLWVSKVIRSRVTVKSRVVVTNGAESSTLSLPSRSVFDFDEDLLGKLLAAYGAKDTARLDGLWGQARPYLSGA